MPSNVGFAPAGELLSGDDNINNDLFWALATTMNHYQRRVQKDLRISPIQAAIMAVLYPKPEGVPFAELVAFLSVSRQNMDVVLKRMEAHGLLERSELVTDRRARNVCLTSTGREAWAAYSPWMLEFYRQAAAGLATGAKQAATASLRQIYDALSDCDVAIPPDVVEQWKAAR